MKRKDVLKLSALHRLFQRAGWNVPWFDRLLSRFFCDPLGRAQLSK